MNGSDRSLKFYCPTHRIRFQATGQTVVSCEQGGHTVGAGFPATSWWEFCCDCGTFWPTDSANGSLQRTECLVCERPLAKRYLCNKCQVVSIQSSALVRRKTYSIQDSGITPDCPGCATATNGRCHEHDCAEAKVRLWTSRSTCPFCEEQLDAKKSLKPASATARVTVCPICNTRQKPGNLFCGRCGKPLPNAVPPAKANEELVGRKSEETAARQKATEDRRRATAEALRVAEEGRRREQEAKRKAEAEDKRKAELAEEARRQEEERQRSSRESQRRAEEEAARKTAAEEARRAAELLRKEKEARAKAEKEQHRLKEVQRCQAEHERLVTELHQRAKEEETRRAKEAATTPLDQHSLTTPEVERRTELEVEAQPVKAAVENQAQSIGSQSASDIGHVAGATAPVVAVQELLQPTSEPGPMDHLTIDEPKSPHENDSFGSSDSKSNEVVIAPEYVPSWDQPAMFTVPQTRRVPRVWLVGLLVLVVVGVMLTVIVTKQRVNTDDNANDRPTPTPTEPIVPVGMVRIPGGEFTLGSDRANADQQEKPAHKVTLAPFYIDTTEVTCEEYQKFVKATGHKAPAKWRDGRCPSDGMRKPVTGVDWYDASAYAKWANKRLPTEEEWELAARGTTGWIYPWGDEWRTGAANAHRAAPGVVAVATFKGTFPFQCYDMVGNAWEWTASQLVPYPGGKLGQEASNDLRVIRGGSWESDKDSATTTYRFGWPASGGKDYSNTSFRCALDAKQPEPARVGTANLK